MQRLPFVEKRRLVNQMPYRVVQPYGVRICEWSELSQHASIQAVFAWIDDLSAQMVRTGAPSDCIELFVVDDSGARVTRPGAH
jgi:hypothetical protein